MPAERYRTTFASSVTPSPWMVMQRVCVRLLFDPIFVDRVYEDPQGELGALVPAAQVRQLVENDRRVWGADPLRRRRALKTLMAELKVSSALALVLKGELGALDGFFSDDAFHCAVQERAYMALGYVQFLDKMFTGAGAAGAAGAAVLGIEGSMAYCRRSLREVGSGRDPTWVGCDRSPGRFYGVVPGHVSVAVPHGTLDLMQHVERWLFEASLIPALSVCSDAPRPDPLPPLRPDLPVHYLVEPGADGQVTLADLEPRWHGVIEACQIPVDVGRLETESGMQERADALVDAGVLQRLECHEDGSITPW